MKQWKIQPEDWKEDYKEFDEATEKFYSGEMDAKTYKGISGGFGSYAQRGANASMLRLRMSGGVMDLKKLKFIADAIETYHIKRVHLTTCQTLQLHDLDKETVKILAVEALKYGIVTRGGGGDFPRNVTVSPLSGIEKGEYFNVLPWALAAADYLMTYIKGPKLPRKLKVGFSNTPANLTHATFRDLGFAARKDGTFDVYSAGGLGNNPAFGVKVAEKVEKDQILYYIEAMHQMFLAYGNYANRAKARSRYMQQTLGGSEKYKEAFLEKLKEVRESGNDLTLHLSEAEMNDGAEAIKNSGSSDKWENDGKTAVFAATERNRVYAQKQTGLYSVLCHPIGGTPDPVLFVNLYKAICDIPDAEIRLCPDESFYVINCRKEDLAPVLHATKDSAKTIFEESVACIGAYVCQQGIRDSQGLLQKLVKMGRKEQFEDGILPKIHISGCPSSCGTHQIGVIGFRGGAKTVDKVLKPAFNLYINGSDIQGEERMGKEVGTMLEEQIPEFLCALGHTVKDSGTDFNTWFANNPEGIETIAASFLA